MDRQEITATLESFGFSVKPFHQVLVATLPDDEDVCIRVSEAAYDEVQCLVFDYSMTPVIQVNQIGDVDKALSRAIAYCL